MKIQVLTWAKKKSFCIPMALLLLLGSVFAWSYARSSGDPKREAVGYAGIVQYHPASYSGSIYDYFCVGGAIHAFGKKISGGVAAEVTSETKIFLQKGDRRIRMSKEYLEALDGRFVSIHGFISRDALEDRNGYTDDAWVEIVVLPITWKIEKDS